MAVIVNGTNWYCYSDEVKPTDSIKDGSVLQVLNTGERWIWNGSKWVEDLSLIYAVDKVLNG